MVARHAFALELCSVGFWHLAEVAWRLDRSAVGGGPDNWALLTQPT